MVRGRGGVRPGGCVLPNAREMRGIRGGGRLRNRRKSEWQHWAQQKCATLCRGIEEAGAFYCVSGLELLVCAFPLCPCILLCRGLYRAGYVRSSTTICEFGTRVFQWC